tara:strand:- start:528 stop:818 length:291 start_codon:yes stop_codon:yes gene_type:complete
MPTYEYECRECNHQFESFQWVDSRLKPTKEACPTCGKKAVKQGFFTAPSMAMDTNHQIDKPHNTGGFADAMERVCQSPAVKGTKYEKRLRDKHLTK